MGLKAAAASAGARGDAKQPTDQPGGPVAENSACSSCSTPLVLAGLALPIAPSLRSCCPAGAAQACFCRLRLGRCSPQLSGFDFDPTGSHRRSLLVVEPPILPYWYGMIPAHLIPHRTEAKVWAPVQYLYNHFQAVVSCCAACCAPHVRPPALLLF